MKTNSKKPLLLVLLICIAFYSCKEEGKTELAEKIPGINLENMDTSVSPKNDFYNYVNGSWMKVNTIPEEESRWGGFGVLRKSTRNDVLEIINTARELGSYKDGTDQKKGLLIFESELDTISRNKAGISPITKYMDKIEGIKNLNDLQTVLASEIAISSPFAGLAVFPNLNDSSVNAPYISPAGLGLPDRDYYLDQDEKSNDIRTKYKEHIVRMLSYIGDDKASAQKDAETILALETKLAKPRLDKVQRRDINDSSYGLEKIY